MRLNEKYHIPDEENVDLLIKNIFRNLYWELNRMCVDGEISKTDRQEEYVVDKEQIKDGIRNIFRSRIEFPVKCSFRLKDDDNPCKAWLGSDTTYEFNITNSFSTVAYADTDYSYIEDGVIFGSKVVVSTFFGNILNTDEELRHELHHIFEFCKQKKVGEDPVNPEYDELTNIIINASKKRPKTNDELLYLKATELYADVIYRIMPDERRAYLSSFVQEIKNGMKSYKSTTQYKIYDNLFSSVTFGDDTHMNNGSYERIDTLNNKDAFEKMKGYVRLFLKYNPKDIEDCRVFFQKEIRKILNKFEDVWYYLTTEKKSSGERYDESLKNVMDEIINESCRRYGDERGVVIGTAIWESSPKPWVATAKEIGQWFSENN